MSRKTSPQGRYDQRTKWAAEQLKMPPRPDPSSNGDRHNIVYAKIQQSKYKKIFEGLGVVASVGFIAALAVYSVSNYLSDEEGGKTCDSFEGNIEKTSAAEGTITADTKIQLPSSGDPNIGVDGVFEYEISTSTKTRSLPQTCALEVVVGVAVDQAAYNRTSLASRGFSSDSLDLGEVFSNLNSPRQTGEARQRAYEACKNELRILEGAIADNPAPFENEYFPVDFLQSAAPKQRIEYLPHTNAPPPSGAYREILFSDGNGGYITCEAPA